MDPRTVTEFLVILQASQLNYKGPFIPLEMGYLDLRLATVDFNRTLEAPLIP